MKRKLFFIFSVLLTAMTAGAQSNTDELGGMCGDPKVNGGKNVTWLLNLNTNTLTISGTGDMADYQGGYETPWMDYKSDITSVVIESGVTKIGNYAFFDCVSLTSITIPDGVTSIGTGSFSYTSLTSVAIPASVESIGRYAFFYCEYLSKVYVLRGNPITTLGLFAFDNCDDNLVIVTAADGDYSDDEVWKDYEPVNGYTVTCGTDITATGANDGPLVVEGETVTLNYTNTAIVPTGYCPAYSYNDGTGNHAISGTTFTMPASNVTISASTGTADLHSTGIAVRVSYIDERGKAQTTKAIALDNTMNNLAAGWYFVGKDMTYSTNIYTDGTSGNVDIILCDGKTLTAHNLSTNEKVSHSLFIYGQSQGTGTINISTGTLAGHKRLNINGGTIIARYIRCYKGDVTINRGTVKAGLIGPYGYVNLNGGNVIISDNITSNQKDVILAGATVTAGSYTAKNNVLIKNGLAYFDGSNTYSGTLYGAEASGQFATLDALKAALGGKTLAPGVTLDMNANGIMTYASKAALNFSNVSGLKAYIVSAFDGDNGTLTLSGVSAVPAGTGLLLKGTENAVFTVPVVASASAPSQNYLMGVTDGTTSVPVTTATNTNFILANGSHGINWYTLSTAGSIGANKAYLSLPTASLNLSNNAPGFTWVYNDDATGIVEMRNEELEMRNGNEEMRNAAAEWFDMQGRKLSAQPTQKGIYILNGKKVVIK